MKKILANKIRCKKCGDIIESEDRHDFKFCKCGAVAVDGGKDYLRRIGDEYEELSEMDMERVRYQWSEDGIAEICDKANDIILEEQECYHCGTVIPKGSNVVRLKAHDGDVYILHADCYRKSCQDV